MALEGLGVASSAFAVVSLAGQLADGIQKLVVFWKSVKNAPAEIANLFNELDVLSKLLIRVRENDHSVEFDSLLNDALQDCEDKVVALQAKVSKAAIDLASKGRGKRSWAALKITIKSKELEAFGKSIDRAKNTLHMIQTASSYNLALWNRAAYEKTAIEVSLIKQTLQQLEVGLLSADTTMRLQETSVADETTSQSRISSTESQVLVKYADELQSKSAVFHTTSKSIYLRSSCETGTVMRRKRVTKQRSERTITTPLLQLSTRSRSYQLTTLYGSETIERTEAESDYILFPNSFLQKLGVSMGIQLTASSTSGWKYTLQPFRAVRPDSLIFDLCRDGDLPGVRRLFARGDASPYDRDSSGLTPLTAAVRASQLEVAEFLLREGSDPHTCDWRYERQPIRDVIDSKGFEIEPKLSMINLLLRYRKEDYETSHLLEVLGRFWTGYRPQKQINMSQVQRQDAQLRILTAVMPFIASRDFEMIQALEGALQMGCGPEVLIWLLQHINGPIDDLEPGDVGLYIPHQAIHHRIPLRAPSVMKMIIQKTSNLHRCIKDSHIYTPVSTPTMIAMRDRSMFLAWRELLRENSQSIPQFVRQELEDGLLKDAGWTENSLRYLFEANFLPDPHNAPSLRGFPGCERCHIVETDISARLVVDLKWRRELRRIRGQFGQDVLTSTSIEITISVSENNNDSKWGVFELSRAEDGERQLPYRMVCSYPCRDGICVAEAFENNSSDEPDLPSFPYVPKDTNLSQSKVKSSKEEDEKEEKENDPTFDMPGSFKESPADASQFITYTE